MTLETYTALRNREQAELWLSEIGIGRPVKKRRFIYVLLISVVAVWSFDVWQMIEQASK